MTVNYWDAHPEFVREYFEGQKQAPSHRYVENVIRDNKYDSVLECGFGIGNLPEWLREEKANVRYAGIDISEEFCRSAFERFGDNDLFAFRVGDMRQIPFADGSFDLVYTRHTLEHLDHYSTALTEMHRVCRKSVVIVTFHEFVLEDRIKIGKEPSRPAFENYYAGRPFKAALADLFWSCNYNFVRKSADQANDNLVIDCREKK